MVTKLELGQKLIMDLIEQSVAAYEQRDELCNKLQNLEGKSQNEQNLHLGIGIDLVSVVSRCLACDGS